MTNRKWVAAFAFSAALAQIVELIIVYSGSIPALAPGASAAAIRKFDALHATSILWLNSIDVLATIAIVAFVWKLWLLLEAKDAGKLHKWSRESLLALGSYTVVNLGSDALQLAALVGRVDDGTTRLLYGITLVLQEAALFPLAVLVIVLASDLRRAAIVPDWQGRWGIIAGAFMIIGEFWIFTSDPLMMEVIQSFIISGSMGFVVWLVALGLTMLARSEESTGR